MTPYEAKYEKSYSGLTITGKGNVTAVQKIGQLVDSSWHFSWHWPEEINEDWKKAVQADIYTRISQVKKELEGLEQAQGILNKIEAGPC